MAKKAAKKGGALKTYKSYNFVDKDPIIDVIHTSIQDSGKSYKELEADSGVAAGTMSNWINGKTRRPFFATAAAVLRACDVKAITFTNGSGKPKGNY